MPQEKIIIKFSAKGDRALTSAIMRLDIATKRLQGKTSQYEQELKKLSIQQKKVTGNTKKSAIGMKSLSGSMKMMALQAVSVTAIVQGLRKSISMSAEMEGVKRGFDNLAKSSGFSTAAFNKFKVATDGTVSSLELMKQANNAMLLGITDSEDQMAQMFDVAQRLGQSLGLDTVQAVESLVTGLGRQSKLMLDNLGIMVDTNKAYEDYAESIGITASQLTDQQKKTAFVNAAMLEANSLVGNLGEEQLSTADKIAQMGTALGDLAITIGDKVAPFVSELAGSIAEMVEKLSMLGATPLEKMVKSLEDMGADEGLVEALKIDIAMDKIESLNRGLVGNKEAMIAIKKESQENLKLIEEDTIYFKEQNILSDELLNTTRQQIKAEQDLIDSANDQLAIIREVGILEAQIRILKGEQSEENMALISGNMKLLDTTTNYLDRIEKQKEVTIDAAKAQADAIIKAEEDTKKSRKQTAKDFVSNMQTMGKAYPEMEKAGKRAAQVQALVDAYASANAAYKAMAGIPFVGPALGAAAAVAAIGAGMANVKMIEQAEQGGLIGGRRHSQGGTIIEAEQGEFVMQRSAVQSVGIENLNRMNEGGGGSAVTVNVSGNVLSQDFVEGELAENIKEAIRRGTDFGIS